MFSSDFTPRPLDTLWSALFLIGGAFLVPQHLLMGLGIFGLGVLVATWLWIAGLWHAKAQFYSSVAELAREIKEMDPEHYRALGIRVPEIRIYAGHDQPIQFFEDTELRMEMVSKFLADSDEYQFAAERLYGDGTRMRRYWRILRDWLIEHGYVINNSAAGNHTWLWRMGARGRFMRLYLNIDPNSVSELEEQGEQP